MTSFSFIYSHQEIIEPACENLISQKSSLLRTVHYSIPPTENLDSSACSQFIEDIKAIPNQDIVIVFGISTKSFSNQTLQSLAHYVSGLLHHTGIYRINFDFTQLSGDGGITPGGKQQNALKCLKKIIKLIKNIQQEFDYSISIGLSFPVSSYLILLEQDLRTLEYIFKEMINISLIHFIVRKDFKKTGDSWSKFFNHMSNKLRYQFDSKFSKNYFQFAKSPSFGFVVYYPGSTYINMSSFTEDDLSDCLTSCEQNNIVSLAIDINTLNVMKFDKRISTQFITNNLSKMNNKLENSLNLSNLIYCSKNELNYRFQQRNNLHNLPTYNELFDSNVQIQVDTEESMVDRHNRLNPCPPSYGSLYDGNSSSSHLDF